LLTETVFKTLAIDDQGRFGLAAPIATRADRALGFVSPPATLQTVVMAARAVTA
jgi:hypothetical protein